MDIQRLRNLTTGKLHTQMGHIYEDIEYLTGQSGIMTHQLPNANLAIKLWLRAKLTDNRFWNGEYDTTHIGVVDIQPMNVSEVDAMMSRFAALPSPLFG